MSGMTDTRRTSAEALATAVAAGDEATMKTAAVRYLDAAKAAGAPWTIERTTRFTVLPLTADDWGALMLAGRGTVEGPRIWARHVAAGEPLAELGLTDFGDLLLCRLVGGNIKGLPANPAPVGLERELVTEADLLRRALDAIADKNAGSLAQALKGLDRIGMGPVFCAGVRAVARSRGVVLAA